MIRRCLRAQEAVAIPGYPPGLGMPKDTVNTWKSDAMESFNMRVNIYCNSVPLKQLQLRNIIYSIFNNKLHLGIDIYVEIKLNIFFFTLYFFPTIYNTKHQLTH